MRKFILLCLLVFTVSSVVFAQQMTDEQVILYVQEAQSQGKTQQEMLVELMKKGVTKEQIQRIQSKYSGKSDGSSEENANFMGEANSRLRTQKTYENKNKNISQDESGLDNLGSQKQSIKGLRAKSAQQRNGYGTGVNNNGQPGYGYNGPKSAEDAFTQQIFGHNIFDNEYLTFEPNINVATPDNYRLGAGDEVIIDVWGASQTTIREKISPEGTVQIAKLGPVYLSGKTVEEANDYLKREFAKIYAGVAGETPNTQINLTLGEIRSIQVNVMGEVVVPGTYTLSSFASVFHALYWAGGVNKIGSLRSIKVIRDGKTVADLDIYDFIMEGRLKDDIRLQDGDVILVNPYQTLVQILGKVKRPMYYEMKPAETVASLLKYAGGFMGDAYKKAVRIIRKSGREHQVYNVDEMDYSVFRLDDGDLMTVDAVLDRFENKVEVSGAVYRPGLYQFGEVNTVKQLIKKAEGLRGDAFLARVLLDREREDLTHEMVAVDLEGIMNGTVSDIPLQKNDHLYVPGIHDLKESETVSIYGEVLNPGTFLYSDNLTIEDMIVQAGGLTEAAATTCVSVTRRIKDPKSTAYSSKLAETFTFDIKDGLLTDAGSFYLQPFDVVQVRRSPAYQVQRMVTVAGEVLFSGSYSLLKKNERLSDVIGRAGGITPAAYIKGGRLIRKRNDEERRRETDVLRIAQSGEGKDSISVDKLAISETYAVGIDMEKALFNPGSDYDIVLREGDIVYIPEYVNTVKISGSVMYPNTVTWEKDAKLKHYINMAGGYGENAKKKKAYIIYLNGTVARAKKSDSDLIQPGCEIVVPTKSERKRLQLSEIMGMSSMTATIAAMVATLTNAFK